MKGASHQKNFGEGRLNYTTRISPALFSSSRLRFLDAGTSSCLTPAPAAEGRSTEDLVSMPRAAFESKSSEVTSLSETFLPTHLSHGWKGLAESGAQVSPPNLSVSFE